LRGVLLQQASRSTGKRLMMRMTLTTNTNKNNTVNPGERIMKGVVQVKHESTPNPDSMKFRVLGRIFLEGGATRDLPTRRSATKIPIADKLFEIRGVKGVFFGSDFVTINKDSEMRWEQLLADVSLQLDRFFQSTPGPLLTPSDASNEKSSPDSSTSSTSSEDSEVVQSIKEILETRVRPAVQEDGGDIEYRGFQDGVVLLRMQGSCSGCPSSSVTLKGGIERMLMHWIPEVQGVMAVSDEDLEKINMDSFQQTEKILSQPS